MGVLKLVSKRWLSCEDTLITPLPNVGKYGGVRDAATGKGESEVKWSNRLAEFYRFPARERKY
jgi:hypothetical protein